MEKEDTLSFVPFFLTKREIWLIYLFAVSLVPPSTQCCPQIAFEMNIFLELVKPKKVRFYIRFS